MLDGNALIVGLHKEGMTEKDQTLIIALGNPEQKTVNINRIHGKR
jgi:hypothetical protein